MRAIANGQVDGFPPPEELRTVYVEHDIDASESTLAVSEFVVKDKALQGEALGSARCTHSLVVWELQILGATCQLEQQPAWQLDAHAACSAVLILMLAAGATHPNIEQVETTLRSVGFTDVMLQSPVTSLSGGWKMKLALGAPCWQYFLGH